MKVDFTVSVVVPTFNRPSKLFGTLKALSVQTFTDFLVYVVDDGSNHENLEQVKRVCESFSKFCKLIEQENFGASRALNNGVAKCPDGLIIILDDDIEFTTRTIEQHVQFQINHGPCIVSGETNSDAARAKSDVERYKIYMEQIWMEKRPETLGCVRVGWDNFIVTTANTSFSKSLFLQIGGFNEKLRDGYDVDFAIRALLMNLPVWFDRSIKSIHNDQITLRYYAKRQSAYDDSKRRILADRPELKNVFKIPVPVKPYLIKKVIYTLMRKNGFVNFVENSGFMKLFPRPLRYRIYGSTIAALSAQSNE